MGNSKLVVANLNCAELGTAQPQLVLNYIHFRMFDKYIDLLTTVLFFCPLSPTYIDFNVAAAVVLFCNFFVFLIFSF